MDEFIIGMCIIGILMILFILLFLPYGWYTELKYRTHIPKWVDYPKWLQHGYFTFLKHIYFGDKE